MKEGKIMRNKKSNWTAITKTLVLLAPIFAFNQSTFFIGEPELPNKLKNK